jgi:predicted RNase H-like HicB family nuclease
MAEQHTAPIEHLAETYTAVFERAGEGTWSGQVPDLPGVLGMGSTLDEAKVSVQEAIGHWIEDMRGRNEPIPSTVKGDNHLATSHG